MRLTGGKWERERERQRGRERERERQTDREREREGGRERETVRERERWALPFKSSAAWTRKEALEAKGQQGHQTFWGMWKKSPHTHTHTRTHTCSLTHTNTRSTGVGMRWWPSYHRIIKQWRIPLYAKRALGARFFKISIFCLSWRTCVFSSFVLLIKSSEK